MQGEKRLSGKKAGEWHEKTDIKQERYDRKERNKTETKRGIEKRKLLAQNFQKMGILFILKEPPASPWGRERLSPGGLDTGARMTIYEQERLLPGGLDTGARIYRIQNSQYRIQKTLLSHFKQEKCFAVA